MNANFRRLAAALLAVLGGGAARAHDPYEITALARLDPGALALEITMARSTALAIATGDRAAVPFAPADFGKLRPRFEASAAGLYAITADNAPLGTPRVTVTLTVERDVEFHLVYPRPAKGPLRFTATHTVALGSGYGDVLTVQGDHGAFLGQQLLTAESPSFEASFPAPAATSPIAAPPIAANSTVSPPAAKGFSWPAAALAVAVVGSVWWRRRNFAS